MDKFKFMIELKELIKEGKDWEIECENCFSIVIILVLYGGGIEFVIIELVYIIVYCGDYNYFFFKGMRSKGNNELYVIFIYYDD